MRTNEGHVDRIIRVIIGLVIIGLGVYNQSWWGAVGLLPLLTGLSGFCALYTLLGINTCPRK
ncbi:MAG: YgaP family membrane protein [Moraxella sp.]|jgi:hypothetical protein